jgi:hypothetical protein
MPDLVVFIVLVWMTISMGLLFYFHPLSIAAKRIRIVVLAAMCGSVVTLSLHSAIADTKRGVFLEIGLPFGHDVMLSYPYSYLFDKVFPVFALSSLIMAAVGPVIYLLKTWRDSRVDS